VKTLIKVNQEVTLFDYPFTRYKR